MRTKGGNFMQTRVLKKFKINVFAMPDNKFIINNEVLAKCQQMINAYLRNNKIIDVLHMEHLNGMLVVYVTGSKMDSWTYIDVLFPNIEYYGIVDAEIIGVLGKYRGQHIFVPDCTYSRLEGRSEGKLWSFSSQGG